MPEIFTRNQLKMIAVLTMLCDHVAVVLVHGSLYLPLRIVGRIAFPIFAYFVVQGFLHTSDYKKYLLRIGIFALISEIPFDLAFQGTILELQFQNVMFTLFLGLGMLFFLQKWEHHFIIKCLVLMAGGLCGWFFRVDYSWFGVVVIGMFYLLRYMPKSSQFMIFTLFCCLYGGLEGFGILGALCVFLYRDGKEKQRLPKYFFYLFYPVHLLILWGIKIAIF